jgi:uncharacterized protein YbjT (DUF2867 family)
MEKLNARGHHPIALVRESSDTSVLPAETELRHGDLGDLQKGVCDGCDAVIFAAGSGGDTGSELTDKIDRDGAMRLVDLSLKAGVKRFVMLSSVGAGDPDDKHELAHYLKAKHDADIHLQNSGLTYAILRPVALTDEDGTGKMVFGDDVDPTSTAARGDVATALADAVEQDSWAGKTLLMQSA